jgi:hypothetical protein
MDVDISIARFPEVPQAAGHYESFWIKAHRPGDPLGFWIRYTVLKPPGRDPTGTVWFTMFDPAVPAPLATRVTAQVSPAAGGGAMIRIGDALLEDGHLVGAVSGNGCEASWDLRYESGEAPLLHLPKAWMYRRPLPRTKPAALRPSAEFKGALTVNGHVIDVAGWPGLVAHNWGAEHAERWIQLHAVGFDGHTHATWLDATIGRIKIGPVTTPWIANGVLSIEGRRHRLGGIERARSTEVEDGYLGCSFSLPGKDIVVKGKVASDHARVVGWVYDDPAGHQHNVFNGSIGDMELTVQREGLPEEPMRIRAGALYEIGVRERDHGMPLQPFTEGA